MFKLNLFAIFWYTTSYSSSCRRSTQTSIKNVWNFLYFWLVLMTLASVLLLCFSNKVVFLSHSKKKMVQFMNFYSEIPKILLNNQTSSILYRRIRAVRKILKTSFSIMLEFKLLYILILSDTDPAYFKQKVHHN